MKKTIKILSVVLAILMVMSVIPITASAATYSGTCGENITWEFDDATGILTISGTGNMYDYLKNNRPKYETYKSQIETVIINDGVNQIGTCAFYQYENLKNVTISDSVKTIETSAFYGCTGLKTIYVSAECKPPYNAFAKVPDTCQVNGVPLKTYLEMYGVNYTSQNAGLVVAMGHLKAALADVYVVGVDEDFSEGLR